MATSSYQCEITTTTMTTASKNNNDTAIVLTIAASSSVLLSLMRERMSLDCAPFFMKENAVSKQVIKSGTFAFYSQNEMQ